MDTIMIRHNSFEEEQEEGANVYKVDLHMVKPCRKGNGFLLQAIVRKEEQ